MRAKKYMRPYGPNPVETRLAELPKGDGKWPGCDQVYRALQAAAQYLASHGSHLSDDHVETMAVLGCGHEETMKAHLWKCMTYGWVQGNQQVK